MNLSRRHDYDVVGIGNALVDALTRSGDATIDDLGLVKGTMSLVGLDFVQQFGSKISADTHVSGGSAANTCAGLASLGANVAFIGRVAKDDLGHEFEQDISRAGVTFRHKASHRPHDPGDATGRCYIFVTPDAERTMATFLGVSSQLSEHDIDLSLVSHSMITYLEGYLWDLDQTKDALRHAMKKAHEAGHLVAISLSDPFVADRHRDELIELIEGSNDPNKSDGVFVDVVFGNEDEVSLLYQCEFSSAAERLSANNVIAGLTQGAKGSTAFYRDETVHVDSRKLSGVIDTTGAGDLYAAGFLFGMTRQLSSISTGTLKENFERINLQQCCELGSLAAAEIISHMGSRPKVSLGKLVRSEGLIS